MSGELISVYHNEYGVLFAAMVSGSGVIVSEKDDTEKALSWMTTEEVLSQLARFGFYVTFDRQKHLSGRQLSYLMTLNGLGFDHISTVTLTKVDGTREKTVIAFNGSAHPEWLSVNCAVRVSELVEGMCNGTAMNVSAMTSSEDGFTWDWLTYVANIPDVLRENA